MKTLPLQQEKTEFMDIQVEKLYLIEQLARVQDAEVINQIKQILGKTNDPILGKTNDPILGYSVTGTPITKKQLIKRINAAEKRIARGEFTTQEDLEKEAVNW